MKKCRVSAISIELSILLLLFIAVVMCQNIEGWGDYYAQNIYPYIAFALSSFSNIFPFAIGDLFILVTILALISYPFFARRRGKKWRGILLREVVSMGWIYVWFYMAWGLNYSQKGLLERLNIESSKFSEEVFLKFAENYILLLNESYNDIIDDQVLMWRTDTNQAIIMKDIVCGYHSISSQFAINAPFIEHPRVKKMSFSPLSSMVGVTGSMAPFFCEFTVNSDVLSCHYPATYAHEMAHQLGITSEAEANFYAYQVCTRSQNKHIRFSGYYSILLYTLGNAGSTLNKEQYQELYKTINPEIILIAKENSKYWNEKYSVLLGEVQNYIYNAYLKSNKISSGTKNYSEVIQMLITVQEN